VLLLCFAGSESSVDFMLFNAVNAEMSPPSAAVELLLAGRNDIALDYVVDHRVRRQPLLRREREHLVRERLDDV